MAETALIIGSEGQDGTLLRERLAMQGSIVVGTTRKTHDLTDMECVGALVRDVRPDFIYYLAAEHGSSEAAAPVDRPTAWERSWAVHVKGVVNFLESMLRWHSSARLFYAASSRIYGSAASLIVNEQTPPKPDEVYGITKLAGVYACRHYRESHDVFAACGILFNHESPLRPPGFISQRLARGAAEVKAGSRNEVRVASLDAAVDWGSADDFVDAMERILRLPEADDFVVATGRARSVRELAEAAFGAVGLDWKTYVVEDPSIEAVRRPTVIGDATKLRRVTGWRPQRAFDRIVGDMVESHLGKLPGSSVRKDG